MLVIVAEIKFYNKKEKPEWIGYGARLTLIPAFNFGGIYLSSGIILNDNNIDVYLPNETYKVTVEFPWVYGEAYDIVAPTLEIGMELKIQAGSRVVGTAKLLEYIYLE